MEIKLLLLTARNAVIEIKDGGTFHTKVPYTIWINGSEYSQTNRVISSIYGLKPETNYHVELKNQEGTVTGEINFKTKYEFVTLNVKDFGAKGDGIQDDTTFIQAAIMACPKDGRVLLPKGDYLVTSLFLKSNLVMELEKGAQIIAETDRSRYPIYPGLIQGYDEVSEYNLGTWEGNPLPMFTGIITGVGVENVLLYGEGTINGRAAQGDWWENAKIMRGAFRPRLLFLNRCNQITIQGLKFENSPAWNIHPYFSNQLTFLDLNIENPKDSPNTDGIDPESCKDVTIAGVRFSLGDDCIALKSGKIYMGKKYKTPCENITIRQCYMEDGHGAVTVGSEMAGGIKNIHVKECIFHSTDRGLRIKTRRGRGKDAIIDQIVFENIIMEEVMTPFVVNCFYFCDPDGKSEYVQSKEMYPVDDRTPSIKNLVFSNIDCHNSHVAAAYFHGLPEQPIEMIIMENINVTYAKNPKMDVPAMMEDIKPCSKTGVFAANITSLTLKNVSIQGQEGEPYNLHNIEEVIY
ncbi:MAG TPA: glycoside hydrolase family 28 protein [Clostridiales bacterium]|jgi:polygalacturonase|nr:glycoside hydrolase family 28 protein [Clostridiales bacterium]